MTTQRKKPLVKLHDLFFVTFLFLIMAALYLIVQIFIFSFPAPETINDISVGLFLALPPFVFLINLLIMRKITGTQSVYHYLFYPITFITIIWIFIILWIVSASS